MGNNDIGALRVIAAHPVIGGFIEARFGRERYGRKPARPPSQRCEEASTGEIFKRLVLVIAEIILQPRRAGPKLAQVDLAPCFERHAEGIAPEAIAVCL